MKMALRSTRESVEFYFAEDFTEALAKLEKHKELFGNILEEKIEISIFEV